MFHSTLSGKAVITIANLLKRSGSTWPGHTALKLDPLYIRKILKKNTQIKVVLIAGTNGKTTTTKALTHILESSNISTLTNSAGANLLNGLASLLVKNVSIQGVLRHDVLIFEVDENSLPLVLKELPTPDAIILLNLFRDQLDRYGEVNSTAEKWRESIQNLSEKTLVIGNADDPQIANITLSAKKSVFYTIDNTLKKTTVLSHAVDSTTCPNCTGQLSYTKISYSHLGNYNCPKCLFTNPKAKQYVIKSALTGNYNLYNLTAAVLAADKIFGITPYASTVALASLTPAFGRQETIEIDTKKIMILLSKNPTGLNESIEICLQNNSASILLLLNDRIPDGRDISWIWDVDFEKLLDSKAKIFVSGDRAYDMANRLLFAGITHEVFDDYKSAYEKAIKETPDKKLLTILPTYSAMLEIRKLISGKSIL